LREGQRAIQGKREREVGERSSFWSSKMTGEEEREERLSSASSPSKTPICHQVVDFSSLTRPLGASSLSKQYTTTSSTKEGYMQRSCPLSLLLSSKPSQLDAGEVFRSEARDKDGVRAFPHTLNQPYKHETS